MATSKVQKATSSDSNLLQPQYGVDLTMNNLTMSNLTLDRFFTWSGTPTNPGFPIEVVPNSNEKFTYVRGVDDGSIAAIIYSGENENGAFSFVLAWDAPTDNTPTPNRVYANCAPKNVIDGYTFEQIREYLNVSGVRSDADDILSKTTTSARINDYTPNIATVVVDFALLP